MRLAQLTAFNDFWRVVREFNPEGIEREANAPVNLVVLGAPGSGRHTLIASLSGEDTGRGVSEPFSVHQLEPGAPLPALDWASAVILTARLDSDFVDLGRLHAAALGRVSNPVILIFTHADEVEVTREVRNAAFRAFSSVSHLRTTFLDARDAQQVQAKLIPLLLESLPHLRMSIARAVPTIREVVSSQIIADTCKVNAQFALVSNLPANLPFIGGIAGNVADFFVLTKNQVMMVFRLAAIHGRDIAPTGRVVAEIAPVIGGGLAWRTAARMVAGMFPTLVAAAPKMAIAYVGTYIAGHAARYYYDEGRRPTRRMLRELGEEGARRFREVAARKEIRQPEGDA